MKICLGIIGGHGSNAAIELQYYINEEINKQLDEKIWYKAGEKPTVCNCGWGINIYEDVYSSMMIKPKNIYHKDLFKNISKYCC